jgi:ribosomal protein S18 acetylase RimI-like enzyme
MAGETVISRATLTDVKMLHQLSVRTFADAFGSQNRKEDMDQYLGTAMGIEQLTRELGDTENYFFLAWHKGRLAGYTKIRANGEPDIIAEKPLEIERIYVLEEFQGKGIGASLMQHCLNHAAAGAYDVVWLGVWELNYKAVNFYKQWQFAICGSHPFLLGADKQTDMLMRRPVRL